MSNRSSSELAKMVFKALEMFQETLQKYKKENNELRREIEKLHQNHLKKMDEIHHRYINQIDSVAKRNDELIEQKFKKTQIMQKLIGAFILLIGVYSYIFWISVQTRIDIREEYQKELIAAGKYLNENNAEYWRKYVFWENNNPNDSKKIIKTVDDYWQNKHNKK